MINPDRYDYKLPEDAIAKEPVSPRDGSHLLVYDTATNAVTVDRFSNLTAHIPEASLFVVNDTKVIPSRMMMKKKSGGGVRVLFLVNEFKDKNPHVVSALADRALQTGDMIFFPNGKSAIVLGKEGSVYVLKLPFSRAALIKLLWDKGTMPIPPYLKSTTLRESALREKYQSLFAVKEGSVAAPTASLHFTDRVWRSLGKKDIAYVPLTLHVGLGTFAPLTEQSLKTQKLHTEWFEIPAKTAKEISRAKKEKRPVLAVGTTVLRALESSASEFGTKAKLKVGKGSTNMFIHPPYKFHVADMLITNFHVPKSSLMMIVDAFLKNKGAKKNVLDLYTFALKKKLRFLSFGDAMLVK